MKNENPSGSDAPSGALPVVSMTNDSVLPKVSVCRYSLRNEASESVTDPGKVPATLPFADEAPSAPSDANLEMVTVFAGAPPSIRSNARSTVVPASELVSTVTRIELADAGIAARNAAASAANAIWSLIGFIFTRSAAITGRRRRLLQPTAP